MASRVQRDLDLLEELRRRRRTLAWIVARQNFVVLLPSHDGDGAQLYAVLGGRLAVEARLAATSDVLAAVELVRERFARYQDARARARATSRARRSSPRGCATAATRGCCSRSTVPTRWRRGSTS